MPCGNQFGCVRRSGSCGAGRDRPAAQKQRCIRILRLRATTRDQLVTLVRAAQDEAVRLGLDYIVAWNVNPTLLDASVGERLVRREDLLPHLSWFGGPQDRVEWVCNEALFATPS